MGTSHASRRDELVTAMGPERAPAERLVASLGLAAFELAAGDLGEALVRWDTALRLASELADPAAQARASAGLALTLALRHEHERAAALLTTARILGAQDEAQTARLELVAAEIDLLAGHVEEAQARWERARAVLERLGDREGLAAALIGLARLELDRGELDAATRLAEEAAATGEPRLSGPAQALLCEAALRGGDRRTSARLAWQASRLLEEAGQFRALAELCLRHGTLLGIDGDGAAASWLARATTLFRAQGATRDVARTREALRRFGRRATDRPDDVSVAAKRADLARARNALVAAARGGDRFRVDAAAVEMTHAEKELARAVEAREGDLEAVVTLLDLLRVLSGHGEVGLPLAVARASAELTSADRAVVALRDGQVARVRMADEDRGWQAGIARASGPRGAPGFVPPTGMVAPLRRGDHVLGAIYCDKAVSGSTFTPRDLELLAGFAGQVALILENARFAEALRRASSLAPRTNGAPATFAELGTTLPGLAERLRAISEAAVGGAPVLVTGEPGTGKRTLAGAIHRGSPRAGGPLVIVDAASLPREALERELFGSDEARGRIDEAAGGTLVIAEIGELPVPAQLRVEAFLARGTVRRGTEEVRLDVRLVATATRDLGPRFRRELRDRLYVTHLELPPLRERTADLPQLTQRILTRQGGTIVGTSAEVLEALTAHSWPGNLRELEQVLIAEVNGAPPGLEVLVEVPATLAVAHDPGRGVRSLVETEHRLLVSALRQHRGNVPSVARALGVSRGTVYNMMRKFRVDPGGFRGPTQG